MTRAPALPLDDKYLILLMETPIFEQSTRRAYVVSQRLFIATPLQPHYC
jgi:hypothetical protein